MVVAFGTPFRTTSSISSSSSAPFCLTGVEAATPFGLTCWYIALGADLSYYSSNFSNASRFTKAAAEKVEPLYMSLSSAGTAESLGLVEQS